MRDPNPGSIDLLLHLLVNFQLEKGFYPLLEQIIDR